MSLDLVELTAEGDRILITIQFRSLHVTEKNIYTRYKIHDILMVHNWQINTERQAKMHVPKSKM